MSLAKSNLVKKSGEILSEVSKLSIDIIIEAYDIESIKLLENIEVKIDFKQLHRILIIETIYFIYVKEPKIYVFQLEEPRLMK